MRIYKCTNCCKRWYFTFNGAECAAPLPIDGIVYMWQGNNQDLHRVRHIEGHCHNIHKGKVRVGFSVGDCEGYGGGTDAYTGYKSVSRILLRKFLNLRIKLPGKKVVFLGVYRNRLG